MFAVRTEGDRAVVGERRGLGLGGFVGHGVAGIGSSIDGCLDARHSLGSEPGEMSAVAHGRSPCAL